MHRRKSFCTRNGNSPTEKDSTIARSTSFTVPASRGIAGVRDGVKILQGHPLEVDEASPRRNSRFQFPGAKLLKAGFQGFRRSRQSADLESPKARNDGLKGDRKDGDSARIICYKGDSNLEKSFTDCGSSAEAFDLFPEEGILSLPLTDSHHPTVFTLSRLSELNCYDESSSIGTPVTSTARTNSTRRPIRVRSSASSFNQETPAADGSSRLESCSSWDTMDDTRMNHTRRTQQQQLPLSSTREADGIQKTNKERVSELDSDKFLNRLRHRSCSTQNSPNQESSIVTSPFNESSEPSVVKPHDDLISRTRELNAIEQFQILQTCPTHSETTPKAYTGISSKGVLTQVESARSDQLFFSLNSQGCRKLEMGSTRPRSCCSERNLRFEKRPDAMASAAFFEKPNDALQCMKPKETQLVLNQSPKAVAETPSFRTSIGDKLNKDALLDSDDLASLENLETQRSNNDCESVLDDPKSLAMWFDWLEERSDVTRKEILYRIKCQKAYLQEANANLLRQELISDGCSNITNPRLKDKLRSLRRRYISKSARENNLAASINDDEIVDISLDEIPVLRKPRIKRSFSLNI